MVANTIPNTMKSNGEINQLESQSSKTLDDSPADARAACRVWNHESGKHEFGKYDFWKLESEVTLNASNFIFIKLTTKVAGSTMCAYIQTKNALNPKPTLTETRSLF